MISISRDKNIHERKKIKKIWKRKKCRTYERK
jgi:hypothetical protein